LAADVADVDLLDDGRGLPVRPRPVVRHRAYVAAGAA
jgi:hypothetical protein